MAYVELILEAMAAPAGRSDTLSLPASVANRWALALRDVYRSWPAYEQEQILSALRAYRDAARAASLVLARAGPFGYVR